MGNLEHLENQEHIIEGAPSKLDAVLEHGKDLTSHTELRNNHAEVDIQSLPEGVDKAPLRAQLDLMKQTQEEMNVATLAASYLSLLNNKSFLESTPKEIGNEPQTQGQTSPTTSEAISQSNMALEIITGLTKAVIEQKKKEVEAVVTGVDKKGNEISTRGRIGTAAGMVPSKIPVIGRLAAILDTAIKIKEDIDGVKPGDGLPVKDIAGRIGLLWADSVTLGLASFAKDKIFPQKKEPEKEPDFAIVTSNPEDGEPQPEEPVELHQKDTGEASKDDKYKVEQHPHESAQTNN